MFYSLSVIFKNEPVVFQKSILIGNNQYINTWIKKRLQLSKKD